MAPIVFIIHASEDKDRFARGFSKRLLERGIQAWFDEWEIQPGDSLVDRIFEEGVKHADVFVIVLSEHSVNKPWVKEELNAAVIKRVNKGNKIIPIIAGDCEVPEALRSTRWQRIKDLNSYDEEFDHIVDAILGVQRRPPLGKSPHVTNVAKAYPELSNTDATVLEASCKQLLQQTDVHAIVASTEIYNNLKESGISEETFYDAIEVLASRGYLERSREVSPIIRFFQVTDWAFNEYLQQTVPDYSEWEKRIAAMIVNEHVHDPAAICEKAGIPLNIVRHVLYWFARQRFIDVEQAIGGHLSVSHVYAQLKRRLD